MTAWKKTPIGAQERFDLLRSVDGRTDDVMDVALQEFPRSMVARDDILDAMVAAVTAGCRLLKSIPEAPCRDALGLPMEMVFAMLG